ncbi:hypothetical protein GIB67_007220 [Kingdonia uniflora]|uniref:TPX2 C-terminal domain-containing protein n=1 Tax=Kingdonia uniflora TaxID=39325 RepID=A0A7J7NX18_9MAGN|nr:hypothetical protein GIB67_007220 [Kingdonia uniflora]
MTPIKSPFQSRSQVFENVNPNCHKVATTNNSFLVIKSAKSKSLSSSSTVKKLNEIVSPKKKIQERRFVLVRKNQNATEPSKGTCQCEDKIGDDIKKCPCVAYESLRASQEELFRNFKQSQEPNEAGKIVEAAVEGEHPGNAIIGETPLEDNLDSEEFEVSSEMGSSKMKRRREKVLEEARKSIPESGKVMHLVKAFERLLSIPRTKDENEDSKKGMKWALPGLQQSRISETQSSTSSFCPPPEVSFTSSDNFGMDFRVTASLDSNRGSFTSRTSSGGRRSRRNSSDSSGSTAARRWNKKQLRVTRQQPFKLRTELRGISKKDEFYKKVQEMFTEEEKLRIPIAQGLPWTTDEPECLVKPPVKEITKPIDLKLHSDVRAVERAEFDHQVSEKISTFKQDRLERERLQKLAEEEEIKRLRRELVPRAQPMPYFDKPFIPKRSLKHTTIPREPKFHIPQYKKIKCMSWSDLNGFT